MFKVGDKVFVFDSNRRVYPKDKSIASAPIYREHFAEREILGETSRSWLVGWHGLSLDHRCVTKYPKKDNAGLYTLGQIDEEVYRHDHMYRISKMVEHTSYKNLKAIADIVGYTYTAAK